MNLERARTRGICSPSIRVIDWGHDSGTRRQTHAPHRSTIPDLFNDEIGHGSREDVDRWMPGNQPLRLESIRLLVVLAARTPHRRASARVEHLEHDAGGIRDATHDPAQRIDLANDLPLGETTDRGVAGHRPDPIGIHGDHRHSTPHGAQGIRRRPSGFDTCMSSADHNHRVSHRNRIRSPAANLRRSIEFRRRSYAMRPLGETNVQENQYRHRSVGPTPHRRL